MLGMKQIGRPARPTDYKNSCSKLMSTNGYPHWLNRAVSMGWWVCNRRHARQTTRNNGMGVILLNDRQHQRCIGCENDCLLI